MTQLILFFEMLLMNAFDFFPPSQGGLSEDTQTVSGFHGWVNAYDEEVAGNFAQTDAVGADCGVSTIVLTVG